jgi:hypothetical protein
VVAALLVGSQARCPNEACRDNLSIYDQILTFIFLLEVVIKFLSGGLNFLDYFTNKERWWNVLDLTVVTCSFLPSIGSMALVLRMVRLLRVLKVVRIVPQLRMLVLALSKSGESIMFTTFLVSGRHQCSKRSECFESILILTCLFHFLRLDPTTSSSSSSTSAPSSPSFFTATTMPSISRTRKRTESNSYLFFQLTFLLFYSVFLLHMCRKSIPPLCISVLLILFICLFASLLPLPPPLPPSHVALMSILRVTTGDDWTDIMYTAQYGCKSYPVPLTFRCVDHPNGNVSLVFARALQIP